ncbi:hypothetical protein HMPREF9946_02227 [Acetobacteraceae bacterium AT-5844]|nr:hypothetical protein HMPREF9946_02227 [Acetobacteraceae bacterium AT-5844]
MVSTILTVITAAPSRRLTTIDAARAQGLIGSEVSDTMVGAWIDQASASIASYCRRPFAREEVREVVRTAGAAPLFLSRSPIVGDPALSAGGVPLAGEIEVDAAAGLIYRLHGDERCAWDRTRIEVTYTAGWVLPGSPARDLPQDVEQACLILMAARGASLGRDPMLRSETTEGVGSNSWIASADMGALPPQAASLLEPYVRVVVA